MKTQTQIQTRIGLAMALTLALLALLAPRAEAQDFVWKGATAAWTNDAQWEPSASAADYANAAKTFLVTSGTVQSVNGGTFAAQLTIRGNGDTNYSGGTLALASGTATMSNWHLDGGRLYYNANANQTVNGALTVDSDSFWDIAYGGGKTMTFNASIAGSGGLKAKIEQMQFNLSAASNSYSGLWTILPSAGKLNTGAANCLGTGWVDILSGGSLGLFSDVSGLTGSGIVVRAGASLSVEGNSVAPIHMQGGTFGTLVAVNGAYTLGGSIYLDAPSTFKTPASGGKWITVNSTLYGTGGITVTNFAGAASSFFDLTVDNSGMYTGAWTVVGGQLKGSAANAFGAGTVTATAGAVVRASASQTIPVFYMGTGSTFYAEWGYTCTMGSLHVAGAIIDCDNANKTLNGSIYVDSPSSLKGYGSDAGRSFTVGATFRGSQRMTFNHTGGAPGPVYITGNSGSTFSGGWTVSNGTLQLQNALGLGDGTGPLTIAAAGPKLYYEAAYTVTNSALTLGTDTFGDGTYSVTNTYVSQQANSVVFTNFFSRKTGVNNGWVVVKELPKPGTVLMVQ